MHISFSRDSNPGIRTGQDSQTGFGLKKKHLLKLDQHLNQVGWFIFPTFIYKKSSLTERVFWKSPTGIKAIRIEPWC